MASTTTYTTDVVHLIESNIIFTSTAFSPRIFHATILSLAQMISESKRLALEARMKSLGIFEDDLEEHFVRSGGAGGQNVNKTSTCVYIKHRPSGTEVKCQKTRSQVDNRYFARQILCEKIETSLKGKMSAIEREKFKIRKQKKRRSRRSKEKILAEKHHHSRTKASRQKPPLD